MKIKLKQILIFASLFFLTHCATQKQNKQQIFSKNDNERTISVNFDTQALQGKEAPSSPKNPDDDFKYVEEYIEKLPQETVTNDIVQISKDNFESNIKEAKGKKDFRNSITNYNFEDGKVYSLIISTKMISDLRLEEGEVPTGDIVLSDIDNYTINTSLSHTQTGQIYHIFIRANNSTASWSIATLPTNKRIYYFKLIPTADIGMLAIKFNYSPISSLLPSQATPSEQSLTNLRNLDFNYATSGNKTIKPIAVFSDDTSTYIQFSSAFLTNSYSPALYLKSKNGLSIINYIIKANMYITNFILEKDQSFILMQDNTKAEIKRGV